MACIFTLPGALSVPHEPAARRAESWHKADVHKAEL
jgi:hypothetical protein